MQQYSSIPVTPTGASQPEPTPYVPKPQRNWGGALSTIAILVAAPLIALFLTAFVFQSYEVDGPSMETTLQNRDRLIVWKLPRTLSKITNNTYLPKRDDVVVFVKPGVYEVGGDKQLIKRVVALPGERVVVQDGRITVYNNENQQGFNPDVGHEHSSNIASLTTGNMDIVVGSNELFVCGDNRTNSLDSRSFGTISANDVIGRLAFRIFPLQNFTKF